jgi:hypothetical protein
MAEALQTFPIKASSGIKRDGTTTEGQYWNEGEWVRFYRQLPKSMGGYRAISENFSGPSRGMIADNRNGLNNVFSGWSGGLEVAQFTESGFGAAPATMTLAGLVTDSNNLWQFTKFATQTGGNQTFLVAHAAPNLLNIDNQVETSVYCGDITTTTLTAVTLANSSGKVSGGVMTLAPFVIAYGNNGEVNVSDVGDPAAYTNTNIYNPASSKIVRGLPVRGGSSSPSGLLWSQESLIKMSFVGGTVLWNFDTISDDTTVLSSNGMVEYDGIYYWPGVDRFLYYNGVVRELPNTMNLDYFFSNLNYTHRQKVFGFKVQKWGEIWWCAPLFGATECNWAIIYNVRENAWYDTPLPTGGRSAAISAKTFPYPLMSTATPLLQLDGTGDAYPLWQHEFGLNEIRGNTTKAIKSMILSPDASIIGNGLAAGAAGPSENVWTTVARIEPDFVMGSQLEIGILTRKFPMDTDTETKYTIYNNTGKLDTTGIQGRYIRYRITTNIQDGEFYMGQPLVYCRKGDPQP